MYAPLANKDLILGNVKHHQVLPELILTVPVTAHSIVKTLHLLWIDRTVTGDTESRFGNLQNFAQRLCRRMRIFDYDLCSGKGQAC